MNPATDGGYSLLEVLVGLAIVALLTAVAATTVTPAAAIRDHGREVDQFVADARVDVILRGSAGMLNATPEAMTYGTKRIALGGVGRGAARLLIYPDGTFGGDQTEFARIVGTPIEGVFR